MGNYISKENIDEKSYALFARDQSKYWTPSIWIQCDRRSAFSQFKHAVYVYALGLTEYYAIYLYLGSARKAKVFLLGEILTIEFVDESTALFYDSMDERLPHASAHPWMARKFSYHYGEVSEVSSNTKTVRRFINLGRQKKG
jgi:hypothetical protein